MVNSFNSEESIPPTPPSSLILAGSILGSGPSLVPPPLTQPAPAVLASAPHGHLANQCVTAMQSILALEDSLVQILQHAMTIYDDDDDIRKTLLSQICINS